MTGWYMVESLLVGGATGFLSGLLGIGGGFILVPLLSLIGLPIHTAMGTSLACIAGVGIAGIMQHARQGSIDFVLTVALALPASLMAGIGARFSGLLAPTGLYFLFSLLTLSVLVFFYFSGPPPSPERVIPRMAGGPLYIRPRDRAIAGTYYSYDVHVIKAGGCGLVTGLVGGFFGVGGGFMLVPLVVSLLHIPLQVTIGTSLAVIIPASLVGAVTHWYQGHIHLHVWLLVTLSGMAGSQFGARYTVRLAPARLKQLFMAVIFGVTLFMLMKGFVA